MKPIVLRQALEKLLVDSRGRLGGNLLGTYTYENGFIEPAITIANPPNDIVIEGLECILPLFPDTRNEWTTESIHTTATWDLILVQHTPLDGQSPTLPAAVDRLTRFIVTSEGMYVPQDEVLGSYPQYRLTFTHSDLYPVINKVLNSK